MIYIGPLFSPPPKNPRAITTGQMWCKMTSDESVQELLDFGCDLGLGTSHYKEGEEGYTLIRTHIAMKARVLGAKGTTGKQMEKKIRALVNIDKRRAAAEKENS